MANDPNIGELFKAKAIFNEDVDGAVDAFLADPTLTTFHLGKSYTLDMRAAVSVRRPAIGILANQSARIHRLEHAQVRESWKAGR